MNECSLSIPVSSDDFFSSFSFSFSLMTSLSTAALLLHWMATQRKFVNK
jgi:hypothetical protein